MCGIGFPYQIFIHFHRTWEWGLISCQFLANILHIIYYAEWMSVAMVAASCCITVTKPKGLFLFQTLQTIQIFKQDWTMNMFRLPNRGLKLKKLKSVFKLSVRKSGLMTQKKITKHWGNRPILGQMVRSGFDHQSLHQFKGHTKKKLISSQIQPIFIMFGKYFLCHLP